MKPWIVEVSEPRPLFLSPGGVGLPVAPLSTGKGSVRGGKLSRAGGTITCLKCGQQGHNQRSCKGQRHQGSHAPPQASQASSQASQAPPSSSQDSQAPPSSSQASQVFTRFTKSTAKFVPQRPATTKVKEMVTKAKDLFPDLFMNPSKGHQGVSKEMYRPWVAPKIAEMFRTRSVPKKDEDELEDSQWSLEFYEDYVPKKKVKSPGPIAVLGLQNKVTWMDMVKKMGIRGAGLGLVSRLSVCMV
ncbi:protein LYK5 [Tanacetum coccineum]